MSARRIKIGIDVGGTFTHAVAIDVATMQLVGQSVVPTTHRAEEGVARGVVESMHKLLAESAIRPDEVVLIAHSTTQATNALLEGDVAVVGIVGMGHGPAAIRARRETNLGEVPLARGVALSTRSRFLDTSRGFDEAAAARAIDELVAEGAGAIVASQTFGVEDRAHEERVVALAIARGLPATAASELSQLYGLRIRTRTAVINASMLPKMLETANRTETAVRASGITAPLMVMRSDGGIMDVAAMRARPILTMLSGPAAGVAAALMYERLSDGIFIEVGGTSSDIALIRRGRPTLTQGIVGGHRLFIRTLDVRTVGVAGGSLSRVKRGKLVEVGPRSAHIAGLGYEAFADELGDVEAVTMRPKPGDPDDYLALKKKGDAAATLAITPTGASTLLGLATGYGRGQAASVAVAFAVAARLSGLDARSFAERLLALAASKVVPVVRSLLSESGLKRARLPLVGGGGGAEAIVPFVAREMGLEFRIAKNAEVISAIGAALGIVQDSVERSMHDPSESDLEALRRQAFDSVVRMGAAPDSIEVHVEVDRRAKLARATARGTPDLRTRELGGSLPSESEIARAAAAALRVEPSAARRIGDASWMQVFSAERPARILLVIPSIKTPVCVVDREGVVRLSLDDARADAVRAAECEALVRARCGELSTFGDGGMLPPDVFLSTRSRLADLTGLVTADQMAAMARLETRALAPDESVVVIASRR